MVGHVKDIVRLRSSEREALEGWVNKGKVAAAKRTRAHILLKADAKDQPGPTSTWRRRWTSVLRRSTGRGKPT